jgi:hypothetical protein
VNTIAAAMAIQRAMRLVGSGGESLGIGENLKKVRGGSGGWGGWERPLRRVGRLEEVRGGYPVGVTTSPNLLNLHNLP